MTRNHHALCTLLIELDGPDHPDGTKEAELQVLSFSPGYAARGWDPGGDTEIALGPFVTILVNGEPVGEMPFSLLVLEYASANHPGPVALAAGMPRMTLARAEEKIEDMAIEAAAARYSDEDDYGEDEYERRLERMERMECAGQGGW